MQYHCHFQLRYSFLFFYERNLQLNAPKAHADHELVNDGYTGAVFRQVLVGRRKSRYADPKARILPYNTQKVLEAQIKFWREFFRRFCSF